MGYVDLLKAAHNAPLVLTDSGGVQKEAFSLGTPCVVLRDTTEWVEQVEKGQSALVESPSDLARSGLRHVAPGRSTPDDLYGDGQQHVPFWIVWKPFLQEDMTGSERNRRRLVLRTSSSPDSRQIHVMETLLNGLGLTIKVAR